MPSRMEKYYKSNEIKKRTAKNQDLYKSIYDEAEYSNVEGISVIEKNEKIDLDKIYELIKGAKNEKTEIKEEKPKEYIKTYEPPIIEQEDRNYDILDVLDKAKEERTDKEALNTQYNILKGINLNDNYKAPNLDDDELKNMIEAISNNSKTDYTSDLLDDLKTIHDSNMKEEIQDAKNMPLASNIDKSFYTSSLSFTDDDFEQIKESIKKNNYLTKILLFILCVIVVTGLMFLIYFIVK
jgi:hypothetical protein